MPRRKRVPTYRLHKPSDQAVVTLDGRDFYLGKYDTPKSREAYARMIAEWNAAHTEAEKEDRKPQPKPFEPSLSPTVNELLLAFWRHALEHYRKHGRPTSTLSNYRRVARLLKTYYGATDAADFSPKALKTCQQILIDEGLSRKTINDHTRSIRHIWKWAVAEELVPGSVWESLRAVEGLKAGRTAAKENPPVGPVIREQVDAIRPYVHRRIEALVDLMWYSGARPGEAVLIRMADVDTSDETWCFEPEEHKTEHHGLARRIWLGPECRRILLPFRKADPRAYLFSPAEAETERLGYTPKRKFQPHYSARSLVSAIQTGCDRAGIPRWTSTQLRHARATEIDRRYGVEASAVVLGHTKPDTTAIYVERNEALARRIALETG